MSTGSIRSVSMIGGCSVTVPFPYLSVRFKLDAGVLGQPPALSLPGQEQSVAFTVGVGVLVGVVAPLEPEQRRLGEVDEAGLDPRAHEAEQQGEQQRADLQTIGIGHQHDLVIARLGQVEVLADAGAEARDEGLDLVVGQHLVDAGLLDVEDLAADRQDRLVVRVAATNRGTTCGVTLDDEDLADRGVVALAVPKLAGQPAGPQTPGPTCARCRAPRSGARSASGRTGRSWPAGRSP